jgi:hypothetical protein
MCDWRVGLHAGAEAEEEEKEKLQGERDMACKVKGWLMSSRELIGQTKRI